LVVEVVPPPDRVTATAVVVVVGAMVVVVEHAVVLVVGATVVLVVGATVVVVGLTVVVVGATVVVVVGATVVVVVAVNVVVVVGGGTCTRHHMMTVRRCSLMTTPMTVDLGQLLVTVNHLVQEVVTGAEVVTGVATAVVVVVLAGGGRWWWRLVPPAEATVGTRAKDAMAAPITTACFQYFKCFPSFPPHSQVDITQGGPGEPTQAAGKENLW
jgi:hypothetical protein